MDVTPVDDRLTVYDANGTITTALKNLWRGCAAFYCCGGPSIKQLDYMRLAERGICSLGLNNIAGLVPVKAFTFTDPPEKFHFGIWRDPGILKLCPKPKLTHKGRGQTREKLPDGSFKYLEKKTPDYPNVWGYERRDWHTPEEFFTGLGGEWKDGQWKSNDLPAATVGNADAGVKKTGRPKIICSMFLGLRLLHYLGVRRVYLLGVDFHMDPSKGQLGNYAFDELRDAKACESNNAIYHHANDMLVEMRPRFDAAGFHVFNCNQHSHCRAFDYVPFSEALDDCRNGVPAGELDLTGWYQKGERGPQEKAA